MPVIPAGTGLRLRSLMHHSKKELGVLSGFDAEFHSETPYFLVLNRFAIGSSKKERVEDEMFDPRHRDWHKYRAAISRAW